MVTETVNRTRDAHGVVHARLLVREGLRGPAQDRGRGFGAGIKTAALDPSRCYANAIRDELPEPSPSWIRCML